jgi:phenylacetic acid degradation operon negative regulatory protein
VTQPHLEARPAGRAASGRRPGPLRGPSARTYLLITLGEYLLGRGTSVWTQTVVDALGLVGFEEKAARQALTRSAAAGWLMSERAGRRVRWRLTAAGEEYLAAGKARLLASGPECDWDGDWLLLLTEVPEAHRRLRHRLRTTLGWVGFGSPSPGVWISPHPSHAEEAREVLRALGEDVHGTLLHARLDDPAERHRLVAQAWDIPDLDTRYRNFMDRFAAAQPRSPAGALAEMVHMVYEWRRLLLTDPGLPPALLPARWSGEQARKLLLDQHAVWYPLGRAWWQVRDSEWPG